MTTLKLVYASKIRKNRIWDIVVE